MLNPERQRLIHAALDAQNVAFDALQRSQESIKRTNISFSATLDALRAAIDALGKINAGLSDTIDAHGEAVREVRKANQAIMMLLRSYEEEA